MWTPRTHCVVYAASLHTDVEAGMAINLPRGVIVFRDKRFKVLGSAPGTMEMVTMTILAMTSLGQRSGTGLAACWGKCTVSAVIAGAVRSRERLVNGTCGLCDPTPSPHVTSAATPFPMELHVTTATKSDTTWAWDRETETSD